MKHRICVIVFVALALLSAFTANAQSPDMVADLAARVNRERTSRGLAPYALNSDLTKAAQAHAGDIARSGKMSHTGSDGSTVFVRVGRTGYGSYSWGRRLGENWAWYRSAADAMTQWMASRPHRENILHAVYREFGIGIAPRTDGGYVFVIDFGARPNTLPVFINDGAGSTNSPNVTLHLTDEQAAPAGDAPTTIGHPTEVMISNDSNFGGASWQPFDTKKGWTVAGGSGTKTVYVKYRDARGRTAASSDSIQMGDAAAAQSVKSPAASPTRTIKPTGTATRTRTQTPTRTRTPRPSATRTAAATRTPRPAETEDELPVVAAPEPTEALEWALEITATSTPGDPDDSSQTESAAAEAIPTATESTSYDAISIATHAAPGGTRVAYVATVVPAQPVATSILRISNSPTSLDGFAVGVFTVAVAVGIIAIVKSRFRRAEDDEEQWTVEESTDELEWTDDE